MKLASFLATLACACAPWMSTAQAALIVSDAVESTGGWTVSGNSLHFLEAVAGISPTAGSELMHLQNFGGRDASKDFSGNLLQAGTYTVSFDIGNFTNADLVNIDQIGMTAGGAWLTPSSAPMPTPDDGTVVRWTFEYDVTSSDTHIGQIIGFRLLALDESVSRNGSFDNLEIDFFSASVVPEPASLALVTLALGGMMLKRRRPVAG